MRRVGTVDKSSCWDLPEGGQGGQFIEKSSCSVSAHASSTRVVRNNTEYCGCLVSEKRGMRVSESSAVTRLSDASTVYRVETRRQVSRTRENNPEQSRDNPDTAPARAVCRGPQGCACERRVPGQRHYFFPFIREVVSHSSNFGIRHSDWRFAAFNSAESKMTPHRTA